MIKSDYVGGEGGKKSPKSDYVICEHSLSALATVTRELVYPLIFWAFLVLKVAY